MIRIRKKLFESLPILNKFFALETKTQEIAIKKIQPSFESKLNHLINLLHEEKKKGIEILTSKNNLSNHEKLCLVAPQLSLFTRTDCAIKYSSSISNIDMIAFFAEKRACFKPAIYPKGLCF